MVKKSTDLMSAEEINEELTRITSTEFRAFATGREYRASRLLAEMHKRFEAVRGSQILLGCKSFSEWVESFCRVRNVSRRYIFYFLKVGRFLLPHVDEGQFDTLKFKKRGILADLAEAGRLSPEFLQSSFDTSITDLTKRAAPLLGKEVAWEESLEIDNHEAAEAALIQLGNMLEYKTYTYDSGKRLQGKKLSEIATLAELPRFPTQEIERSAKRIDVIWVKDEWPDSFFEVENTTNVTSGLHRLYQVLKFEANFFIVAPEGAHGRFLRAITESPYNHCPEKFLFRSYHQLSRMFQAALKYRKAHDAFFAE